MNEKPKLPEDPIKKEKIRNILFSIAIIIMVGLSVYFFWRAFSIQAPAENTTTTNAPADGPIDEPDANNTTTETGETTYSVQSGDTLWGISEKFGVTVDEILDANNLKNGDNLQIGQVLKIPAGGKVDTSNMKP